MIRRVTGIAVASVITAAVSLAAFTGAAAEATTPAGAAAAATTPTGAAAAATPHIQPVIDRSATTPSADQAATVRHRDATGAITSVWHGPQWQADQLLAEWSATHGTTSIGSVGGVVSPNIERPPHCGLPTTYWVFRADSLVCYRYGGTANINIKNVYEVDSGNNAGYYVVGGTRYYVQKYIYDLWDPKVTVTQIHIN